MRQNLLNKVSANQMFIWFMALNFLFVAAVASTVTWYRVSDSAREMQQQTSQQEMLHARRTFESYLNGKKATLEDVASLSYVRNFAMGISGSADRVKDVILTNKPSIDFDIVIVDIAGDTLYEDSTNLVDRHSLQQIIGQALESKDGSYSKLCVNYKPTTLSFTAPILHKGLIEGVIIAVVDLDFMSPQSTLFHGDDRWIRVSQDDRTTAYPKPITSWLTIDSHLDTYKIDYHYGIYSAEIEKRRSTLVRTIILVIVAAMMIAYLAIYLLGKQFIINPYTELISSRKALRSAEKEAKLLASVAEHSNDGVVITDEKGQTLWINNAFTEVTGYALEEIEGRTPGSLLQGPETSRETKQQIRKSLDRKEPISCEILNYTKAGDPYWLELQINPVFSSNGTLERFIAIERDITERHKIAAERETMLRQAEQASIAKSQFLATMSHEIRTPMNGVLGIAQLLMKTELSSYQREQLEILFESGNHMMAILNDILDFSKIEQGKLELDAVDFNLNELINSVTTIYHPLCQEKGLTLTSVTADDAVLLLNADKARIRQVLYNLLGNAIKFTAHGSIHIAATATPKQLTVVVSDTGIGIAEDRIEALFDPFTQAELSTTRKFGGSGLGLSIVKKLCKLMGGDVSITSKLGEGTTVTATFGVTPAQHVNDQEDLMDQVEINMKGKTALIVEDNAVNAMILQSFLEDTGFEVTLAEDGALGVAAVAEKTFDAIFMDNHMPNMDGIEAIGVIRNYETKEQRAPCIIIGCTADAFAETKVRMVDAGAQLVITKPVSEPALHDALRQLM